MADKLQTEEKKIEKNFLNKRKTLILALLNINTVIK
jgi:hypothetical protein